MALHCTMTYHGAEQDDKGLPNPWFHYLVVASPGATPESGIASIVSLSEARAEGIAKGTTHTILAKQGGPVAAIKAAEEFLDKQHPRLKKILSTSRPSSP